jgi:hypothetical protein
MPKFSFIRSRVVFLFAYRSILFELAVSSGFGLKFEFEQYLAVYRGIPRYKPLPPFSGKNSTVGKKPCMNGFSIDVHHLATCIALLSLVSLRGLIPIPYLLHLLVLHWGV